MEDDKVALDVGSLCGVKDKAFPHFNLGRCGLHPVVWISDSIG